MSRSTSLFGISPIERIRKGRVISRENLANTLLQIEEKLSGGMTVEAEQIITYTLANFSNSFETQAKLNCSLSFALEMQGRYSESLKVIKPFEDEEILRKLKPQTYISVLTQLAIAYNNANFPIKALKILDSVLEYTESNNFSQLFVGIYVALARVYRSLKKYDISRECAEKSLRYARETGDWYRMAEAYQVIAACCHQEDLYEKSLDYFLQAIKIIGEREAPFLLGQIYSDISTAYWSLRRPFEAIDFLEKSIGLFEKTGQKYQATSAYYNLGINLTLVGEWNKAEEILKRSLELALETRHLYKAVILNSLGELNFLRGDYVEAEEILTEAFDAAEKSHRENYAAQIFRNLARCFLAQGRIDEALQKAQESAAISTRIGEAHIITLAELVLAEIYLHKDKLRDAERILQSIEEIDLTSDFFVLGEVQRIRGLLSLADYDEEVAVHHFSRSLSFFETAGDVYHTALAKYEYGRTLGFSQPDKARKYLASAADAFAKLNAVRMQRSAELALEKLKKIESPRPLDKSANSQLLTMRLAEAVASRELIFRELIAILQQESKAKKIIVAEFDDQKRFYPFISQGYTPAESSELTTKMHELQIENRLEDYAQENHLSVFQLRAPSAPPATLIVYPFLGDTLADGTAIQPLLRVVELGMDVCALREKDKAQSPKEEFDPFVSQSLLPGFIHSSPAMAALVEEVYKIRSSDVTVLITGESGTGKELVSRAIHSLSQRRDKVFIPFNCTAIPRELAEGYFFGYRKGSFTGAVMDSPGMIRNAEGGTLFLDEVGDLPLEIQPKLLRFLQEGEIQPLGERRPIQVDVRVIAATNSPLEEKVANGTFREDLYYRLNVIRLHVPPLRDRRSEIPQIANYYVNHYSAKFGRRNITLAPNTMDLLTIGSWAGNVRQLCNEVQRLVARAEDGETITPDQLSPDLRRTAAPIPVKYSGNVKPITSYANIMDAPAIGGTLEEAVAELEKKMIGESMHRHSGNISRVAKELGLTRRGLYLKLDRYGLSKAG